MRWTASPDCVKSASSCRHVAGDEHAGRGELLLDAGDEVGELVAGEVVADLGEHDEVPRPGRQAVRHVEHIDLDVRVRGESALRVTDGASGDVHRQQVVDAGSQRLGQHPDGAADLERPPVVLLGERREGHGALADLVPARGHLPGIVPLGMGALEVLAMVRRRRRGHGFRTTLMQPSSFFLKSRTSPGPGRGRRVRHEVFGAERVGGVLDQRHAASSIQCCTLHWPIRSGICLSKRFMNGVGSAVAAVDAAQRDGAAAAHDVEGEVHRREAVDAGRRHQRLRDRVGQEAGGLLRRERRPAWPCASMPTASTTESGPRPSVSSC